MYHYLILDDAVGGIEIDNFIKIGVIGDFESERPSHKATNEALNHCAKYLGINIKIQWLPTESLEKNVKKSIGKFDGLWCAPGEYKSTNGALKAIQFAREKNYPFIGTCGGFQYTVIEYARNKLGLDDVQHAEYNPDAANLIITPLPCSLAGETQKVFINKDSRVYEYYYKTEVEERFSCRFGINPYYRKLIDESGFRVAGTDENGDVRILDLVQNNFFIATLFQPQLSSLPMNPHRLILAYLTCSKEFHFSNGNE
jgi:CTP synthase (UTP-ammonia lyase)